MTREACESGHVVMMEESLRFVKMPLSWSIVLVHLERRMNMPINRPAARCVLALLVAAAVFVPLGQIPAGARAEDKAKAKAKIRLVIDYGDGVQKHFTRLPASEGATVLAAVEAAARHPRGIKFKIRGSGSTTFLTQIDDAENQGARGRNWTYRVNGKLGDRSCALQKLKAGDTILWKFEQYQ